MRKLHRSPALLLAALIIACDSSSPTSPVQGLDTDLNVVEITTGGLSGYATGGTGFASGGGFAPALPPMYPSRCAFNAETQFFACPMVSARGLVIARKYQLLDGSGAPLSAADPSLSAIRSVIDVQGTTTGMMVNRHEDNTLSGLQTANRTLNGTSTQDLTLYASDGSVALLTHDESSISDLSIVRSLDQKYPLGGSIVSDGTTSLGSHDDFVSHYHREVVFDGTSVVTVKSDYGSGLTTTCKIDLANSSRNSVTCVSGTTGL